MKRMKIEREIERREREEKEQRAREIQLEKDREQQRVKELFDNATYWNKCVLVRDYIAAVQSHADRGGLDSWVEWANQKVDQIETELLHPET